MVPVSLGGLLGCGMKPDDCVHIISPFKLKCVPSLGENKTLKWSCFTQTLPSSKFYKHIGIENHGFSFRKLPFFWYGHPYCSRKKKVVRYGHPSMGIQTSKSKSDDSSSTKSHPHLCLPGICRPVIFILGWRSPEGDVMTRNGHGNDNDTDIKHHSGFLWISYDFLPH